MTGLRDSRIRQFFDFPPSSPTPSRSRRSDNDAPFLLQALLYLIYLLDPLVKSDYVIAYFHTLTSTANYPSFQWLKEVYNILPYK